MPFKAGREEQEPDFSKLLSTLTQSDIQKNNPPLYQVIKGLINGATFGKNFLNSQITNIIDSISSINNSIVNIVNTLLANKTYITVDNESVDLPNSRQLLAGTGVTFDDSIPNERTINVTGGGAGVDHVVLSDGVQPPTPVNDGNGNFIYIPYIP